MIYCRNYEVVFLKTNSTINFICEIDKLFQKDIPSPTIKRTKQALLDYICVSLAGAKYNKSRIDKYISTRGFESGNADIIGIKSGFTLKDAVFFSGLNAHALDYDDGTNTGIIHLGSPIFSVILPLAQKYSISVDKVLQSAIKGYETSFTLALTMQPTHKLRGFHATGTCGTIGATMAVCELLSYSFEEKKRALSIASTSATGFLNVLDNGSELKPYNVAKAALMALVAVQMVQMGYNGEEDALTSQRGFLKMMTGNNDIAIMHPFYNNTYAINKAYIKPYAACRYCHPAIEAAIRLRESVLISEIKSILVKTYSLAIRGHDHVIIENVASAKMSIPYGVAVALYFGKAGLMEYTDDVIRNDELIDLCGKIEVIEDERMTSVFPEKQCADVIIITSKANYCEQVEFPKGEPENPLSDEEFKDRFLEMCIYSDVEKIKAEKVYSGVSDGNITIDEIMNI